MAPTSLPPEVVANGRRDHTAATLNGNGHPLPLQRPKHPLTVDDNRMSRNTRRDAWRAGCAGTRTSGSEGGPGKRTLRKEHTAPRPDPYLIGKECKSAVGTLVERTTRYVMLLHLPAGRDPHLIQHAMRQAITTLPAGLARTITWDQGIEMIYHADFTIATGIPVYFCDPHSPWQRGSNENTNGLLRQYLPKKADLSCYSQSDLDEIALRLNQRPRKTLGFKTPADKLQTSVASTP